MGSSVTERFAPSPTGELHLGHAFSALIAHDAARSVGGRFLLRMEDLDQGRVREHFANQIRVDLEWLGITWDGEIIFQSRRRAAYDQALSRLAGAGLVYRCSCTRRDIAAAAAAPHEGVLPQGPDGVIYPGTCRHDPPPADVSTALRLDMALAIAALGGPEAVRGLDFREIGEGHNGAAGKIALDPGALLASVGDVVLQRKDGAPAYHLAVVVDDAAQGVSTVTRGEDLFDATSVHRLLQALLGLPTPSYRHHRLIRDENGKRLAKRDRALSLGALRAHGWQPLDVFRRLGLDTRSQFRSS